MALITNTQSSIRPIQVFVLVGLPKFENPNISSIQCPIYPTTLPLSAISQPLPNIMINPVLLPNPISTNNNNNVNISAIEMKPVNPLIPKNELPPLPIFDIPNINPENVIENAIENVVTTASPITPSLTGSVTTQSNQSTEGESSDVAIKAEDNIETTRQYKDEFRHITNDTYFPNKDAKRPWFCPFDSCNSHLSSRNGLLIHYRRHTPFAFACKHCDKKFARYINVVEHRRIHTGERPFQCKYCKSRFTQSHRLTEHERIHTGERPFRCNKCSKRFSVRHNMLKHRKIHKSGH